MKAIQADTQEAVYAMERSTQGVVEGTKASDAAGRALNHYEAIYIVTRVDGHWGVQARSSSAP